MSDHDGQSSNLGYVPIAELDDHRHQTPAAPLPDRPRRGTFDSLYGARRLDQRPTNDSQGSEAPSVRVRDFEEAIVDGGDAGDVPSMHPSSRRPTFSSQRSVSPPNSVKAFAQARRREHDNGSLENRDDWQADEEELRRTASVASRRSVLSKARTIDDMASIASRTSAHADVCFPAQEEEQKEKLAIDFEYLEDFIAEQRISRVVSHGVPDGRVFSDLRPQGAVRPGGSAPPTTASEASRLDTPVDIKDNMAEPKVMESFDRPKGQHMDPNRISFFSSAWESTIHAAELGDLVLPGEDLRNLFDLPSGEDGVWWLNVNNPSKEEATAICKAFGAHPLTTEDIATQESREKIELFPSYYFACFRSFNTVDDEEGYEEYEPFNIYAIVFREGTLSFSFAPNSHASNVRKRIALLKDFVALSSDWICYALIDDIVDSFFPIIHQMEIEVDAIEDSVFMIRDYDSPEFLQRTGRTRRNIVALMRLISGKADVLKGFTKRCNANYMVTPRMDIGLYLGDIQDHVITMMTSLGHFEKMLSRAHSNYLAQLTISNINTGTDTNRTLSKITVVASILVPLNLISGTWGMNVPVPWEGATGLGPFFGIVGVELLICIVCIALARKLHYL